MTTPVGVLFNNPRVKPLSSNGVQMAACTAQFYLTGTTSPATIYADGLLTTPLTDPVQADASGTFPAIYLDPNVVYRVIISTSTGVLVSDTDPVVPFPASAISAATVGQVLYPRTAAEIAGLVTPSSFAFSEGDIRRYGASTSSGTNQGAINSALTVSANGGAAAYIPGGTWGITATLNAFGNSSMFGEGSSSVISVNGCDGINFLAFAPSPLIGRRVFRDFSLTGVSTSTFRGIVSAISPAGVFGVTFQNIAIQNFGYMCYMSGFRLCSFIGILGRNNNQGFYMIGQNTNIEIVGCSVTTDTGGLTGVTSQILAGNSTQGVHLIANYFFGYDTGIAVPFVFDLMCIATDFANCNKIGADITGGVANCLFDDCLFETNSAGNGTNVTKGAIIEPLGVTGNSQITFTNCEFEEITPIAGSIGISIPGANNNGAILNGNHFFQHDNGIVNVAGTNTIMRDNRFFAITNTCIQISSSCTDNVVGPIYVESGTPVRLAIITSTPAGLQYYDRGTFTLGFTGMTGSLTGTANWVASGSMVTLSIPTNITGTSAAGGAGTAMTATGIPAVLRPVTTQQVLAPVQNNSVTVLGTHSIDATGTITFSSGIGGGAFTSGGAKGLNACTIPYAYL